MMARFLLALVVLAPLAAADGVTVTYLEDYEAYCYDGQYQSNNTYPNGGSSYATTTRSCNDAYGVAGASAWNGNGSVAYASARTVSEESQHSSTGSSWWQDGNGSWSSTHSGTTTGSSSFDGVRADHGVADAFWGTGAAGCATSESESEFEWTNRMPSPWGDTTYSGQGTGSSRHESCGASDSGALNGERYHVDAGRACNGSSGEERYGRLRTYPDGDVSTVNGTSRSSADGCEAYANAHYGDESVRASALTTCSSRFGQGTWTNVDENQTGNETRPLNGTYNDSSQDCLRGAFVYAPEGSYVFVGQFTHATSYCETPEGGQTTCSSYGDNFAGVRFGTDAAGGVHREVNLLP